MYLYNLYADLSQKIQDSVTPFVIVNLSNDQYLENHGQIFSDKIWAQGMPDLMSNKFYLRHSIYSF